PRATRGSSAPYTRRARRTPTWKPGPEALRRPRRSRCNRGWRNSRAPLQRSAACAARRARPAAAAPREPPSPGLTGSQGPRDDEALDLAGAFEKGVDLGVAVPLLDGEVADVAVAAADLDRLLGDLHRHLAGLELRHRAFGLGELATVAAFPQGPPDQRAGGLDLGRHVGEHEGDRLVLDQGASELLALLRVLQGELEGSASDAERLGAHDRPRQLEGLQSDRGALVVALAGALESSLELLDATEHVLERDRAVLEQHLGGVRGADSH